MEFKKTKTDWSRLGVAGRNFLRSFRDDLANELVRPAIPVRAPESGPSAPAVRRPDPQAAPVIFASYATDAQTQGSHRYCGGEKLLNNLILLLRRKGFEAYMVSLDGTHAEWLAEHAPFLSLQEFSKMRRSAANARCVTSWIHARPFLDECPQFYFWDHELSASSRSHFPDLARFMAAGRIIRTAGVNRSVQSFHRAVFESPARVLRQLIDEKYWKPDPARQVPTRVGYFDEGDHGAEFVARIREITLSAGLALEFTQLAGVETEIISQMQGCGTFLALNVGKSPLWGEGGPMSPQEAMACGTVPICFDINGPWELIQQNYNGVVVSDFTPDAMACALIGIYSQSGRWEITSRRALEVSEASHTMEARWPDVARFLDLPPEGA